MAEKGSTLLSSSASHARRTNKPLMEKRRRQRINECLTELKALVLQAMQRDTSRYSKLEKADILEMTVKHLRSIQRQQMAAAVTSDPSVLGKYRAGFNECANEVTRYMRSIDGINEDVRLHLLNHLASCAYKVNQVTPSETSSSASTVQQTITAPQTIAAPQQPQPQTLQPIHVQIPSASQFTTVTTPSMLPCQPQQTQQQPTVSCPQNGLVQSNITGSFQLIPGTLPNGQVAYILQSPSQIQNGQLLQQQSNVISPVNNVTAMPIVLQTSPNVQQQQGQQQLQTTSPTVLNIPTMHQLSPAQQQKQTTVESGLAPLTNFCKVDGNNNGHSFVNAELNRNDRMWRPW
ncbi:transcription factor HES-4-B [Lingula anatina]|uniref:Transcription factor HES-4-B n=1 Tax=Lingula anatina TaxID=7574 RepID=A0A1S3IC29_LINAN|nr:transcription factor HES-4-B [Lingula anatina]|eukprot:XP_013395728.1 transcription factor HES-4-B [Lingula anatina]